MNARRGDRCHLIGLSAERKQEPGHKPIFNFSLGKVLNNARAAQFLVNQKTGKNVDFTRNGSLNAYGLGGSLMIG
jgi:hypothetical protein